MNSPEETPLHRHQHAVQFYGNEQSLFTTVAGFLGEGLIAGQPAIVIATESHRAAIVEHLCGRLIDCDSARRNGSLLLLDAEDMLGQFMFRDVPDPDLFEQNVGRLIQQMVAGRGRPLIRAYGEMVDVLWKQGRPEAAIKLEILWNKLALKYSFALLCGYAMGNFYKQAKHLDDVCAQHTQIIPHDMHDTKVIAFDPKRVARTA
jgi:DcmR-like sensory protein